MADVLTKLTIVSNLKIGDPLPKEIGDNLNWGPPIKNLCQDAAAEIIRLRSILKRCQSGSDVVAIGDGDYICLHLRG